MLHGEGKEGVRSTIVYRTAPCCVVSNRYILPEVVRSDRSYCRRYGRVRWDEMDWIGMARYGFNFTVLYSTTLDCTSPYCIDIYNVDLPIRAYVQCGVVWAVCMSRPRPRMGKKEPRHPMHLDDIFFHLR